MKKINMESIKQILRFGIVGVLATAIQYVVYIMLYASIGTNIAYTVGYGVSLVFNFVLSNYFTFKTNPSKEGGIKFGLAHGFNYLLQMALLNIFIYMNISENIAPFIVYSISIPLNYLLVKKALNRES